MNSEAQSKANQLGALQWALILALIGGIYFLQSFLGVIILGLLFAYLFFPVKTRLSKYLKRKGTAVALTTLIAMLTIAIPLLLVVMVAVSQTYTFVNNLETSGVSIEQTTLEQAATDIARDVNSFIESTFGISEAITENGLQNFLKDTLPKALERLTQSLFGLLSGIPTLFTLLIIFLFVFVGGLSHGEKLVDTFKRISPFSKKVTQQYLHRTGSMAKAMMKGQMIIAILQGLAGATSLALIGLSEYFWFFALFFTFLSFIPLGSGIITIPLGLVLLVFGNISGALIVLFTHFVIVTNIDNIVRPKVVPKDAYLPAALTMLAAFAGVGFFGFIGVIYGPIIMIVIVTTIQAYIEQKEALSNAKPKRS